jgi:hypothetical protein
MQLVKFEAAYLMEDSVDSGCGIPRSFLTPGVDSFGLQEMFL